MHSSRVCVINYASGAWYPRGQARLVESLKQTGFKGDILTWSDPAQLGCPAHSVSPYAFKPHALLRATALGYDIVLWADASVWALKPIDSVIDYLQDHSHLFFHNTSTGMWTSDACLRGFGITRDEAMGMPMLMGLCMGWNMTADVSRNFLAQWLEKSIDGFSFQGAWTNDQQQVSTDPRCRGHRHDQSVASILACKLGMPYIDGPSTFFSYWEPKFNDSVVLTAQGM